MAGYTGTPLAKKLGIKEHSQVALVNAPKGFERELGSLPASANLSARANEGCDLILFFAQSQSY